MLNLNVGNVQELITSITVSYNVGNLQALTDVITLIMVLSSGVGNVQALNYHYNGKL